MAKELERHYEEMNLIVAHMGRGITIGVHKYGKVVDVNNGLHGEGPFSPERAGTRSSQAIWSIFVFQAGIIEEEMMQLLVEKGGFVGYLGTNDVSTVEMIVAKWR